MHDASHGCRTQHGDTGVPMAADHLGRLLAEVAEHFQLQVLDLLHRGGHDQIRGSHLSVVARLGHDTLRLNELARRGGITQQAMGKLIRELAGLGYLTSRADQKDRRARRIQLSPLGEQLLVALHRAIDRVRTDQAEILGHAELAQMEQSLRRLLDHHRRNATP